MLPQGCRHFLGRMRAIQTGATLHRSRARTTISTRTSLASVVLLTSRKNAIRVLRIRSEGKRNRRVEIALSD